MDDEIIVIKTKRNDFGLGVELVNCSLPKMTASMIRQFARDRNLTVSRAIHDLVWYGYHAEKGDYKTYAKRLKK